MLELIIFWINVVSGIKFIGPEILMELIFFTPEWDWGRKFFRVFIAIDRATLGFEFAIYRAAMDIGHEIKWA